MRNNENKKPLSPKKDNLYAILLILALFAVAIGKDRYKEKEFSELRNDQLMEYTKGVVHDVSRSKYGSYVYWYHFNVKGKEIGGKFQSGDNIGLSIGSNIKVAYLRACWGI